MICVYVLCRVFDVTGPGKVGNHGGVVCDLFVNDIIPSAKSLVT